MKKSLLALAILSAFASAASAQSSVVLYGIVDASTSYTSNQSATGGKKLALDSGGLGTSRWGVKGTEYLDGGLKVNFRLESTLRVDDGSTGSLFDRNATVGMAGDFGSFDAGRQDNLSFAALASVDPSNNAYTGSNPNVVFGGMGSSLYSAHGASSGQRQNNSIKFTAPAVLGGLTFSGMYAFGEKAGNAQAGSYAGVSASYSASGVTAVFAYSQSQDAAVVPTTLRSYTGGAKFAVNALTFKVTVSENEVNASKRNISVFGAGVDYALSPSTTLTAAYYANRRSGDMKGKADQYVGVAKYAFSKRTSAYTSLSYAKAGSKLAADTELGLFIGASNKVATRLSVGVWHAF